MDGLYAFSCLLLIIITMQLFSRLIRVPWVLFDLYIQLSPTFAFFVWMSCNCTPKIITFHGVSQYSLVGFLCLPSCSPNIYQVQGKRKRKWSIPSGLIWNSNSYLLWITFNWCCFVYATFAAWNALVELRQSIEFSCSSETEVCMYVVFYFEFEKPNPCS